MKKENELRKSNIELLRIVLTILIIIHHFTYHNLRPIKQFTILDKIFYSIGPISVITFMIITGFFMIEKRTKCEKILKTVFTVLFYSLLLMTFKRYLTEQIVPNRMFFMPIINKTYWFISEYLYIYMCIPFINIF